MRIVLLGLLCGILAFDGNALAAEESLPSGPALTAEAFDALTRGKRMDTFDPNTLYGIEEFLPGRRSVWRDASGCKSARWQEVGDQICFYYEDNPEEPDCWVYKEYKGAIWGWLNGQSDGPTVRLVPGDSPMECDFTGV